MNIIYESSKQAREDYLRDKAACQPLHCARDSAQFVGYGDLRITWRIENSIAIREIRTQYAVSRTIYGSK
jgi:hypothetical protein